VSLKDEILRLIGSGVSYEKAKELISKHFKEEMRKLEIMELEEKLLKLTSPPMPEIKLCLWKDHYRLAIQAIFENRTIRCPKCGIYFPRRRRRKRRRKG